MRWLVHGEEVVWSSPWLSVRRLDVEQPDGKRVGYDAVRLSDVAAAVVTDAEQRVLLLWRHRFLTDTWAWELPMGIVEPGEAPADAAAREVEEETGWRPGPLTALSRSQPGAGIMDSTHYVFRTTSASYVGEPVERNESDRIEWVQLADVQGMIERHEIVSGITLIGLQQALLQDAAAVGPGRPGGVPGGS
ncbi:NUDIX hydrolase [Kribbella qitaiheensis]|uniref:NUDIX hydrolase n=1 Tax=Kribbella qitaiheensis TaxID=1544730 RepID=A0A7G6WWH5_9ACTN|nr:NUDIX hydrolase [Kribbella qitaiheensis]QNE18340.1 NUDIX hydrolase [Kribbella qitaiheensis]